MDTQTIFDRVAKHLMTQKKKSLLTGERRKAARKRSSFFSTSGQICAYRGNNGLTCAIGCLIPNRYYSEKMEGKGISQLGKYAFFNQFTDHQKGLLNSLQSIHDGTHPRSWKRELRYLAKAWSLKVPSYLE